MRILTINCGSSTLKFELFEAADGDRSIGRGVVDRIDGHGSVELIRGGGKSTVRSIAAADHGEATLQAICLLDSSALLGGLRAVGHRVVHGGARFSRSVLLDAGAEEAIEELTELAPLHNGPALAAIRAVRDALGSELPQVAAFDTAFHTRMPANDGTPQGSGSRRLRGYKQWSIKISAYSASPAASGRPPSTVASCGRRTRWLRSG